VIADVLRSFASERSDNWPELVPLVEFVINDSTLTIGRCQHQRPPLLPTAQPDAVPTAPPDAARVPHCIHSTATGWILAGLACGLDYRFCGTHIKPWTSKQF
jgi:hypothetical protein